ncbi:MAG: TrkA family potassium uptake protein [Acholeplasmataceae bacterium]|nr:MAG: TrkA family potassium uptake protein [Acholeplasmataceae bacterium]
MKIVIAGGKHEADFIVNMFKEDHHELIVINPDHDFAEYISTNNDVPVFSGDPTKAYCLSDAEIQDADVLIALNMLDTDNYVTCMIAKRIFNVTKTVCIVRNPKNVDIFKTLGVDAVISSTYMLGQMIKNETSLESIIKTLSFEDEKIVVIEIGIEEDYELVNKTLQEIEFPSNINISCIYRDPHVIIPKGSTVIKPFDRLIVISTPQEQAAVIKFLQKRK